MSEEPKGRKWSVLGQVWFWSIPIVIIVGIVGALLYLLYTWSAIAGGIVTAITVWLVGCLIFAARSLPKDGQDG